MARKKRRRRRVRRRNSWKGNRRGHRKAARKGWRRRRSRTRRRRRAANPALSLRRPMSALTAGFNVNTLKTAGIVAAGAVLNAMASKPVINMMPIDALRSGPGSYIPGLATAGALGGLTGMVAPKFAGNVLMGGVLQVALKALGDLTPYGLSGLSDYLTAAQVQQARPLAGMGDYLTAPQVAQARPLMTGMGYGSDDWLQGAADSISGDSTF